ncbi:CLUMA_CG002763, isoform A [Clunio marinus]|uniref:CLUMA_CG002763, isoform A n=1 Tax=Clunio marinus TaxID=568069 RepID=A0A1J1HS34_9DIPT|nr:CLUMA_CG002763, isoform A [Clunio marinus]
MPSDVSQISNHPNYENCNRHHIKEKLKLLGIGKESQDFITTPLRNIPLGLKVENRNFRALKRH